MFLSDIPQHAHNALPWSWMDIFYAMIYVFVCHFAFSRKAASQSSLQPIFHLAALILKANQFVLLNVLYLEKIFEVMYAVFNMSNKYSYDRREIRFREQFVSYLYWNTKYRWFGHVPLGSLNRWITLMVLSFSNMWPTVSIESRIVLTALALWWQQYLLAPVIHWRKIDVSVDRHSLSFWIFIIDANPDILDDTRCVFSRAIKVEWHWSKL